MNLKIVRMVISMDKKTIKRLLTYCKPYRFLIMLLTLLSIVSVVFTLLTPVLIGQAIDLLVGKNQVHFQALLNKLIFIGIVILIISLIQWIMGQITNTITYNITDDISLNGFVYWLAYVKKLERIPTVNEPRRFKKNVRYGFTR